MRQVYEFKAILDLHSQSKTSLGSWDPVSKEIKSLSRREGSVVKSAYMPVSSLKQRAMFTRQGWARSMKPATASCLKGPEGFQCQPIMMTVKLELIKRKWSREWSGGSFLAEPRSAPSSLGDCVLPRLLVTVTDTRG